MRRPRNLIGSLALLAAVATIVVAARGAARAQPGEAPSVDLVKVDGVIDASVRDYVIGTIELAERAGATVLLQLDSPGTMAVEAGDLMQRVLEAQVPVITWVGPVGARAAGSAVAFLAVDALSVASPGVGIGPEWPADLLEGAGRERPPAMTELPPIRTALTAQEALDAGVVDLANPDLTGLDDVLRELDGRVATTAAGDVTLETFDQERGVNRLVRFHDLGPGRRVLHAVANPGAVYVLLVLGLALIAFELTQAGLGVAGVSGAALLGLGVYGLVAAPPDPLGLVLLLGGVVAMIVDVRLRRLGPPSIAGLAAFAVGSFLVYRGVADAIDLSPWLVAGAVVGSALYYLFGLTVAIQSRDRLTSARRGLVGLVGEARGPLAPDGPVFVKGTLWRGRAMDGPIPPGTRIRVRGVDGLVLRVEAEAAEPEAGRV
jgi:membrane-bound serine protease (ClpP class)